MNDPIKEFVEQNRAAFDELEAPAFNLEKFKKRFHPEPKKKSKKLWPATKWMAAASIIIVCGAAFLLSRENKTSDALVNTSQKVTKEKSKISPDNSIVEKTSKLVIKTEKPLVVLASNEKINPQFKVAKADYSFTELYKKLSDSSSSTTRLSAILDINKSGRISNDVLDKLSTTLNHDENSNVRLAALSVLEKYIADPYASSLLVGSLNTQTDPLVQLGLVTILGKMKNLNINDKLYALASDPNTFDAVKDEAYSILLKEDKL